jgi:protein ImuB
MLRRFLQQISIRLNAVYLVVQELTLRIKFGRRREYSKRFKVPQPTNEIDLLFRMLHTHLENFTSDHPITAVTLAMQPIKPCAQQFGLFETALRDPNQLYETLSRLTALFGSDRVGTPVVQETHQPDSFHLEPFSWELPERPPNHAPGRVALRRFRPAASAAVLLAGKDLVHARSGEIGGAVSTEKGPYIGSGNWWDHEKAWGRREWDLELDGREVIRVHQPDPLSPSYSVRSGNWAIDGIYD